MEFFIQKEWVTPYWLTTSVYKVNFDMDCNLCGKGLTLPRLPKHLKKKHPDHVLMAQLAV